MALFSDPLAIACLYRGNGPQTFCKLASEEPTAIANQLRGFLAHCQSGDNIELGWHMADFGKDANLTLPPVNSIVGQGQGKTIWKSWVISDSLGTSFCLQNGLTVEGMSFINDQWFVDDQGHNIEDGRCIGFDSGDNQSAVIRNCSVWCRDWSIYSWQATHTKLLIDNCDVYTGRVGVACENSGDGQDVTILRSRIYGDASLSWSRGETSNQSNGGVFGVICRGGTTRIIDSEINIKGKQSAYPSYTPRACAITDQGGGGDAPAGTTQIAVWNLRSHVDPNGADPALCWDVDMHFVGKPIYAAYPASITVNQPAGSVLRSSP